MQETYDELEIQVKAADSEGIVQLCSTHDEGSNLQIAYPADYSDYTIAIAACDEFGNLPNRTPHDGYKYRIRGTDISAGAVPFLNSDDKVTGSSVATAIAAGLASLILSCHRYANPQMRNDTIQRKDDTIQRKKDTIWKKNAVKDCFKKMENKPGDNYILLEKFCGIDKEDEPLNVRRLVHEAFGPKPKS